MDDELKHVAKKINQRKTGSKKPFSHENAEPIETGELEQLHKAC